MIGIGRFLDARRENNSVFVIPGMPRESEFINQADLGPWAASALAHELSSAGYPVQQFSDLPPDTVNFTITGRIPQLTINEVVFQLQLKRGGLTLLDRQYLGQPRGLGNPNHPLTQTQIKDELLRTYQDLAKRVIRDITTVAR